MMRHHHLLLIFISHQTSTGCVMQQHVVKPAVFVNWAPQSSVVSQVIFAQYTDDCLSKHNQCTFVKYSDDKAIIDLSCCKTVCQEVVSNFAQWCGDHFLDLSAQKPKELIVDFKRDPTPLKDLANSHQW